MPDSPLVQTFQQVDAHIRDLERILSDRGSLPVSETVDQAMSLVSQLIRAYLVDAGEKDVPADTADLLDVFKVLVKGDPSWNTIRDNCRELVFYRNCLDMARSDALPRAPEKMAVRTLRHLYLFMKTRAMRENRLDYE
jgi:hypothetical protein